MTKLRRSIFDPAKTKKQNKMKNLTNDEVMKLANVSLAVAYQIDKGFLETKKIYTHLGDYANYAVHFFTKKFKAIWVKGNDAPRGGKRGNYLIMVSHDISFNEFAQKLIEADNAQGVISKELAEKKKQAVAAMNIEDDERLKFLSKTLNMSTTQAKKTAHHFAAKKLGFYSTMGRDKFMQVLKMSKQN